MVENVRETDSPEREARSEVADPTASGQDGLQQVDEHAAMRQTVAREYADAVGKRYEPPREDDAPAEPRFDKAQIDRSKVSAQLESQPELRTLTGLGAKDADRFEGQIRNGLVDGKPVAGTNDKDAWSWTVDVPVTGPTGSTTVRTTWTLEAGDDRPRLAALALPPRAR